jgi:hypothetical protein
MPTDAIVTLERLRCLRENDGGNGHSEPYLWPVLFRLDENTLASGEVLAMTSAPLGWAHHVVADDMRAGQSAPVPGEVGALRQRFEDGTALRRLILCVALLESDDTPDDAWRAGYEAFRAALRDELADVQVLQALSGANPDELAAMVDAISARVEGRVKAAISGALTVAQKARYLLGLLNLDDAVDSDFHSFTALTPGPFTLAFASGDEKNRYEIDARLATVEVAIDRCADQVHAVALAQAALDSVYQQIEALQAGLHGETIPGEPPLSKAAIMAEIRELRAHDLPQAEAGLEAARTALRACRLLTPAELAASTQPVEHTPRAPRG